MDDHLPTQGHDSDPRPLIRLYEAIGLGVLVPYPSGIVYSNQTGGYNCLHPTLEGFYLPIGNDLRDEGVLWSPMRDLWDYFVGPPHRGTGATMGLTDADADVIDAIMARYRLDTVLRVDRTRVRESHEAWVWVEVLALDAWRVQLPAGSPPIAQGVLTWENSD